MHALTPFIRQRWPVPYITDWLPQDVHVVPVRTKGDLAVPRKGAVVHRIDAAAAMLAPGRVRYAARWLCGNGSTDVVLLANADAHGGTICVTCAGGAAGNLVYRCFAADGALLYIGSTRQYGPRMAAHAKNSHWWSQVADVTREPYPSMPAALAAERVAIRAEHPLHNKAGVVR